MKRVLVALSLIPLFPAHAQTDSLVIAEKGKTRAAVLVRKDAGEWERRAATDLVRYIHMMAGAKPQLANTPAAIDKTMQQEGPVIVVGELAPLSLPSLRQRLAAVAKKDPTLRADAIVARRVGNRIFLAGLTDDGHYHAVSYLLHHWGCRWYLPTDFGECIPERERLAIDDLDHAHASPFELRSYWLSWLGKNEGADDFMVRNFMTRGVPAPGSGHALAQYVHDIVPEGKSLYSLPIAEERTIDHVASKIDDVFKKNGSVSLAMEDGIYTSNSPIDEKLKAGLHDKYMMRESMTDVFMTFYNGVCNRLLEKYPDSKARIGFLAYSNMTLPPQQVRRAAKPLVCALAPIDIDPIHGMDDPRSPPRQEYRQMMQRWSEVMEGRVWIYDYDQGMLVWRDIPNPSHQAFQQDVRHYAQAGIIGLHTESRGAFATTFLNLHLRGQLMWQPDLDVTAHLADFYTKFYGPAAVPMARYWNAIFRAWSETICTEHEFFIAPAIYTQELIEALRTEIKAAEKLVQRVREKPAFGRNEKLYVKRVTFTRLSFDLIDQYMAMVRAATRDCDYVKAAAIGEKALKIRERITAMGSIFTTTNLERGAAWFTGEVELYRQLAELVDGTHGELVQKLPLEWPFRRDPNDGGLARGWAYQPADLTYWNEHKGKYHVLNRKDYPTTRWEVVQTDLYPQAQGILHPDWQSFTGHSWYKAEIQLAPKETVGKLHLRFPGLFAEAWLFVNGRLVAHRPQGDLWWLNDYSFSWDVEVTGKLQSGRNDITLRNYNVHHVSGMFRRPFLYRRLDIN